MKVLATACLLFLATPAVAADEKPKPTCGKTVEECQARVEALQANISRLTAAVTGLTQQRNSNAAMLADAQLQAFVLQQTQKPTPDGPQ